MGSFQSRNPATLLSNASATGSSTGWQGGRGFVTIEGTWSGATATLQWQSPISTWISLDTINLQWTANGAAVFEAPPGNLRVSISGSPSAVYAYLYSTDAP